MNSERYTRQTMLRDFGAGAQQRLSASKVLVVGAGGLGIPVLTYLNAMGIGTMGVVDADVVSFSNLHRQVLYDENHVGQPKVEVILKKLREQNSNTVLIGHCEFLNRENALKIMEPYDVVVDASDNFPTRYLVNDACVLLGKPFVYGALHGFEGQASVFNYNNGPTYRCLFPNMPGSHEVPDCNTNGVLGVIPGIIGNLQALETVKVLTGIGEVLSGKLLLFNGLTQNFQRIRFPLFRKNLRIDALLSSYDFECDTEAQSIDSTEFERLLNTTSIQVVDVRTSKEYHRFHLNDTKHIPLSQLQDRQSEIDFGQAVYFICQSGIRSKKAITKLRALKKKGNLINVHGGINNLSVYVTKS